MIDFDGRMRSDWWLDKRSAKDQMDLKLGRGDINPFLHQLGTDFLEEGWCRTHISLGDTDWKAVFDDLWENSHPDLAFSDETTGGYHFLKDYPQASRNRSNRFPSPQRFALALEEILFNARIGQIVKFLLGRTPLAYQSLLFERGSSQEYHRDTYYVKPPIPSMLVGVWVALEDVVTESGPLCYFDRSHKIPYPPEDNLNPDLRSDFSKTQHYFSYMEYLEDQEFLAKKGEVLFWHRDLLHGGSSILDQSKTRMSYVIHYTQMTEHPIREDRVGGTIFPTNSYSERGGIYVMDSLTLRR